MEALSSRLEGLRSKLSGKTSENKNQAEKPTLRSLRTKLSGVDDIMNAYNDPTEVLFRCEEVSDFKDKQARLQGSLRKECKKEIDNVVSCLAKLEEEIRRKEASRSKTTVMNGSFG